MYYEIGNGKPHNVPIDSISPGGSFAVIVSSEEAQSLLDRFSLPPRLMDNAFTSRAMAYESHEGFDFMCVNLLRADSHAGPPEKICVWFTKDLLLFAGPQADTAHRMLEDVLDGEAAPLSLERLLLLFFERLTTDDTAVLEDLEQEITDLEDALITAGRRSAVRDIISLRQRLMAYKRHYEQLLSVLDMLQENDDDLLSESAERTLKVLASRADRLYHAVLNLRDYVTQVRETYQAEVDISLNRIMKLFTVITAIFLPLTFIVGWYGMNLQMPEFRWSFGYPMVIIISVIVVVLCLVFFKKRKWF